MIKVLALIFAVNMFGLSAIAEAPNIPDSSWEQYQGVIAVALFLKSEMADGRQKEFLKVFIKNISQTDLGFYDYGRDGGVRVFYVDQNGTPTPLHAYTDDILHNKGPTFIRPGGTLLRAVYLTPAEMTLLQSHLVECQLAVYDPVTKKGYKIETAPKTLSVGP
jgi:hypothetical protein